MPFRKVNVSTNPYSAEHNNRAGVGIVDVVTKSGTNQHRGSAYEFFRNTMLHADPNHFHRAVPNPPFRQEQYGASLGAINRKRIFMAAP